MDERDAGGPGERRRYLVVVEEVLRSVAIGTLSAGDRLPNERTLAERCEVSRATVREALLALELGGVVEVRPGSGAYLTGMGIRTGSPPVPPLDASPRELLEARQVVEPAVARLCAGRVSRHALDQLARIVDQAEQVGSELGPDGDGLDDLVRLNLAFHRELAQHCGNLILASLTSHLVDAGQHPLWLLVDRIVLRDEATRANQIAEHRAVLAAVADGRVDAATAAMADHLGALSGRIFGPAGQPARVHRVHRRRA